MNQQAMTPPDSAASQLLGTLLSTTEVSTGQKIHEISVAMSPLQHADHLVNFADNFGAGGLDSKNKQLHLQFHVVVLFCNAMIEGFWLSVPGRHEKIVLSPKCVASPVVGKKHSSLTWSAQSRFMVDEVVKLPDWANRAVKFELMAEVAGKPEKIGAIFVSQSINSLYKQNSVSELKNNITLISRWVVERFKGLNRLFLITVFLPTLISAVYFGVIASDVYISESKFIIRTSEQQTASPLGMMLKGVGFSRSQDDSYTVQDFILSRDALHVLDEKLGIRQSFSKNSIDIFSRFAGLDWDKSIESLYKYYQKKVDAQLDSSSSIVTLDTRAFTAEDSFRMNQVLLEMSEALVNQLNERGRQDMIKFAALEVAEAEKRDKEASMALAKIQTESSNASGKDHTLASKVTEYQRFALEKGFADKMLSTAVSSLEEARSQALQKQLYLARIAQPNIPDEPMEPRRFRAILTTFILGMITWGVLVILLAGVREHSD